MAGKAGPYVNNDGLVFHFDTGNTVRSFKGEPTTNIITPFPSTVLPAGVVWTYEYATEIVDAPISNHFLSNQKWVKFTKTSSTNGRAMFLGGSFTAGNTYTWTMYVYCDDNRNTSFAMGSDNTNYSQTTTSTGYNFSQLGTVQRIRGTWNQLLNGGSIFGVRGGASNVIGSTIYVTGLQCEQKANPTQLTTGTRSSTQGLLDLTGNSTINLVNVSFNSNAQITFDGTNDFIGVSPRRQYGTSEPWTTELVFKPTTTNQSWNGLFGGSLGAGGYWMFHSTGNLAYYEGYFNPTTKITYRPLTLTNTFFVNRYHHLTITYNGVGTYTIYVAGKQADTFNWTFAGSYSLDMQFIGAGDGRYGTNDVHFFKQYNRALTASEVERNFNAVRTRFGI